MKSEISSKDNFLGKVNQGNIDDLLKYITTATDLDSVDEFNRDAVHISVLNNDIKTLNFLLGLNNININHQDRSGFTPLHYACQEYYYEIVKRLIEAGANVNLQDIYGNTPLFKAVYFSKGRGEIIDLLLKNGADPNIKNLYGNSSIDLASSIANYEVKKFFN